MNSDRGSVLQGAEGKAPSFSRFLKMGRERGRERDSPLYQIHHGPLKYEIIKVGLYLVVI